MQKNLRIYNLLKNRDLQPIPPFHDFSGLARGRFWVHLHISKNCCTFAVPKIKISSTTYEKWATWPYYRADWGENIAWWSYGRSAPIPRRQTTQDVLETPREGKYTEVRRYIEERKRFDEEFKTFCVNHSLRDLCTRLTNEFGWFVDENSLQRNINRNR